MYKLNEIVNLAEARRKLPELADRAHAGHMFILSRRGRNLAVIIGVDEYRRLSAIVEQQRQHDFDTLLAPPPPDAMSEEEAELLAAQTVREVRQARRSPE